MIANGAQGQPVMLSANVSVSAGQTAIPDVRKLQNLHRGPCAIEQVRFIVRGLDDEGEKRIPVLANPGGLIRAKITMGRLQLTRGFVPVWNLGPEVQEMAEVAYGVGGALSGDLPIYTGALNVSYATYRWQFAHPLIVPPGAAINTEIFYYNEPMFNPESGLILPALPVRVDIAYAGRALPIGTKMADVQRIPFATAAPFDLRADGSAVRISGEDELANPFHTPFSLHRFVARVQRWGFGIIDNYAYDATKLVQIRESKGYAITTRPIVMAHLSDPYRRAWTFAGSLDAKERVQAELLFDPDAYYKPMFSLVGWRNERIFS